MELHLFKSYRSRVYVAEVKRAFANRRPELTYSDGRQFALKNYFEDEEKGILLALPGSTTASI